MPLSTENRTGTLRWSKGAARLSCDSPQGTLKDPWKYVKHRAAAVQAPYVSLAMLIFPGRPSHGDCEYYPFGYKYKYRDSCIAYHNHGTRTAPSRHPHGTRTAPARHPHGTRTTHLLTVGSPHNCRPATSHRSYGRLFQFLNGTARTSYNM